MQPGDSSDPEKYYFSRLEQLEDFYLSYSEGESLVDSTSKFYQLLGQFASPTSPKHSSVQSAETSSYQDTYSNMDDYMTTYGQEDYYPDDKIYDIFGKYRSSFLEDSSWHDNLSSAIELLNSKLGSPRIRSLHPLWYSGFEDRELRKLEKVLLTLRIILDDVNREGKELKIWRIQYRHLKDLLCQVNDILDDIALRAPQLKELFQSNQVSNHPYLTDKLLQMNKLIQGLEAIGAEIKSMVLPEFNTRRRITPAMSSQAPPVENRKNRKEGKRNDPDIIPTNDEMPLFYAIITPQSTQASIREPAKHVPVGKDMDLMAGSYDFKGTSIEDDSRKKMTRIVESYDFMSSPKEDDPKGKKTRATVESYKEERVGRNKSYKSEESMIYEEEPLATSSSRSISGPKQITSISNLPRHLKKCLLYTSLFPSNHEFEKDALVQMWIAVGYIQSEEKTIEDAAGDYFDKLLSMQLFQVSELDGSRYTLKDDVYRLVQEGTEGEYARLEDGNLNGISKGTLHASVLQESTVDPMIFKSFHKLKRLHSLLLLPESRKQIKHIPYDLILSLKCVCVLDLRGTQIKELPSSVGDIKTLHYLDLSETPIKSLPPSICRLSGLQILKLRDCFSFIELPKDIKSMINLRHLELDITRQLTFMPPRMGKLTNLQALSAYIAGKGRGSKISELKDMVNLGGSLHVTKLENVLTVEDAEEAALYDKEYLRKLEFQWSLSNPEALDALEGLEPHKNIEELRIVCYAGLTFPTWFGDSSFSKLASISIYNCRSCTLLPLLGRLPSLKSLHISEMHALKKIDSQFSGGGRGKGFPKLETLEFDGMHSLQEWTGVDDNGMQCLRKLIITDCPNLVRLSELSNLKSLQHLEFSLCFNLPSVAEHRLPTSLQRLMITDCPKLKERCQREGLDWHKISDIPNVWIDYLQVLF